MKSKILLVFLITLVVAASCGRRVDNEYELISDRVCEYETIKDYTSELSFDMPLFYEEIEDITYNEIEVEGFYVLGESNGQDNVDLTSKRRQGGRTQGLLVNDDINFVSAVDLEDIHNGKFDANLVDYGFDSAEDMIERNIISTLFYEYYEEYFKELNNFLSDNNVPSFWDYEELSCGRKTYLSSFYLSHINVSKHIKLSIGYLEITEEQKQVISNAIQDGNLSIKTNMELKKIVEEIQAEEGFDFWSLGLTIATEGNIESDNKPQFIVDYEDKYNSNFEKDLNQIIEGINIDFVEIGLKKRELDEYYFASIYYIEYENGIQINTTVKDIEIE